jgi:quinol monooxygenase YgiN
MALYMTARYAVKPESVEICQDAIREFVDYITRNEPETRMYVSVQEEGDQTRFLHFFIFENEHAEERHANSEAVKKFASIVYPECLEPVEFTSHSLVASTEE